MIPDVALDRLRGQLGLPPVVGERYVIDGLAGRGGMGEVYRATDLRLDRPVAFKVIAAERGPGTLGERLQREARILARLEHPGIVPVHDAGTLEDGRAWYVMRFVDGRRLDEATVDAGRGERLRLLLRVAETVAFAHGRGIVHRDLKPANVMVGAFGEVVVLDWGVAALVDDASEPVGTPGYMAPEQGRAGGIVDGRTDVFALGVMLRDLVERAGSPVPRPLASIMRQATAADPAARYPDAAAFAADLRRWLDDERVLAHREGAAERLWRFARRHQVALLLLLAYVVLRTAILLWRGI